MEQDSSAYQECRHPANMLLLLFLGYASVLCTDSQISTLPGSVAKHPDSANCSCTLRHCKDKHTGETDPSRMAQTLHKLFVSVRNHTSRIHNLKQLKALHGAGPVTCAVSPKSFCCCPWRTLPNLSLCTLCNVLSHMQQQRLLLFLTAHCERGVCQQDSQSIHPCPPYYHPQSCMLHPS